MRKARLLVPLFLLLAFGLMQTGCLVQDKVIEILLTDSTCAEFTTDDDSENFTDEYTVDYAGELGDFLDENGISRDDIVSAHVVSAKYKVTVFESPGHDWTVSGEIQVERDDIEDGPDVIIDYTDQSIMDALGVYTPAVLNGDGVELMNDALADFLDGSNPILTFRVVNGDVEPTPTGVDPIVFDWEACVTFQLIYKKDFQFPDLFGG
jgi:hypothetical protein